MIRPLSRFLFCFWHRTPVPTLAWRLSRPLAPTSSSRWGPSLRPYIRSGSYCPSLPRPCEQSWCRSPGSKCPWTDSDSELVLSFLTGVRDVCVLDVCEFSWFVCINFLCRPLDVLRLRDSPGHVSLLSFSSVPLSFLFTPRLCLCSDFLIGYDTCVLRWSLWIRSSSYSHWYRYYLKFGSV